MKTMKEVFGQTKCLGFECDSNSPCMIRALIIKCYEMEHFVLTQEENTLQVKFVVRNEGERNFSYDYSPNFEISNKVVFCVKVIKCLLKESRNCYYSYVLVRCSLKKPDEKNIYNVTLNCHKFGIKDKCLTTDNTWHYMDETLEKQFTFDLSVIMKVMPHAISFEPLLDDENLADFELRGEDGAIRVHRAVLAAASPVLGNMLCGSWLETTEGHMKVPETSKETLQHFKNYIYLSTLPEDGLEQLLLLASCYMMSGLEQQCVDKLMQSLTAQNYCDRLVFAKNNNLKQMLTMILVCVKIGKVKIDDIVTA